MKKTFYWLVVLLGSALTLGGQFLSFRPSIGLALSAGGAAVFAFPYFPNAPSTQVRIACLPGMSISTTVGSRYGARHFSGAENGPLLSAFHLGFTKSIAWLTGAVCAIIPAPLLRLAP
ncbi:hypothetical protein [Hymenobacter qilianensis]|uniref:Uncharacterized protein n=1 Tax=Hymenobacter qilianensis TaxID=1385715 RepID=A0A7H0GT96_9BACT|nr:hypothetical protein [Hymenobacter qilianensis]QNP51512.1 hypothetical protein H9L05_16075 [Hymenobacter qilianensis]